MIVNRFSLIVSIEPAKDNPEWAEEVERYVDVLALEDNTTVSSLMASRTYLLEHLQEEFGITLELHEEENDSIVHVLYLDRSHLDQDKVLNSVFEALYTEIELAGFPVLSKGTIHQEIKMDTPDERPPSKPNPQLN